jgi:hypothetical protein
VRITGSSTYDLEGELIGAKAMLNAVRERLPLPS